MIINLISPILLKYSRYYFRILYKQVAGAGFGGQLLICLLNLTLNKILALHLLQFPWKYHVFLDSLRPQIRDHTHRNSGPAALYYTAVELEKM